MKKKYGTTYSYNVTTQSNQQNINYKTNEPKKAWQ